MTPPLRFLRCRTAQGAKWLEFDSARAPLLLDTAVVFLQEHNHGTGGAG